MPYFIGFMLIAGALPWLTVLLFARFEYFDERACSLRSAKDTRVLIFLIGLSAVLLVGFLIAMLASVFEPSPVFDASRTSSIQMTLLIGSMPWLVLFVYTAWSGFRHWRDLRIERGSTRPLTFAALGFFGILITLGGFAMSYQDIRDAGATISVLEAQLHPVPEPEPPAAAPEGVETPP